MGTWGTGFFEDDTSMDFLDEYLDMPDPREAMKAAFAATLAAEYIDSELGHQVLVGGVLIRSAVTGELQCGLADSGSSAGRWIQAAKTLDFSHLRLAAAEACTRVGKEGSELFELWNEGPDMGAPWNAQVEELAGWLKA
ncbi:DUF4259 domain-containing protein [Pinirhizobacter soli]|uniref:DUF4259 domain-containing protein n=1 Tax=Pinirhizobacter soli TaxID=2786953 RepID=UPI0025462816|nr:DUF4259 domain-containing protein [Pinirhizobacter soli]